MNSYTVVSRGIVPAWEFPLNPGVVPCMDRKSSHHVSPVASKWGIACFTYRTLCIYSTICTSNRTFSQVFGGKLHISTSNMLTAEVVTTYCYECTAAPCC